MKLDNDTVIGVIDPDDYHIELHLSDLVEPYRTALEIGMAAMEVKSLSHEAHAAITELDRQRAAGYNPPITVSSSSFIASPLCSRPARNESRDALCRPCRG